MAYDTPHFGGIWGDGMSFAIAIYVPFMRHEKIFIFLLDTIFCWPLKRSYDNILLSRVHGALLDSLRRGAAMTEKEKISKVLNAGRKGVEAIPSDPEDRKIEILTCLSALFGVQDRSGSDGRKIRRRLRSLGFRLSNPAHVAEAKIWSDSMAW